MDLHGCGDRWKRNPLIILCVAGKISPLLIINPVLAGNIPVIRMGVNHWSDIPRRARVSAPPVAEQRNCTKQISAVYS